MRISRVFVVTTLTVILSFMSIYRSYVQERLTRNNSHSHQQNVEVFDSGMYSLKYPFLINETSLRDVTSQSSTLCNNCTEAVHDYGKTVDNMKLNTLVNKRQIWISMGLCFSTNTKMYKKQNYPYAQVTPLAILLWYHFFPDIRIILYLVYDQFESNDRRYLYEEQLNQTNVEIRWVQEDDIDCVTKSQLIRMWAFQDTMIKEKDIIITVDVNLFVVSPNILKPIYDNLDKKLWVFMWYDTAFIETGIGETFNQNLMSAESRGKYTITGFFV